MSNKKTVEMYIDGFRATDHAKILSCLADNVVWDMPGFFLKRVYARICELVCRTRRSTEQ